MGRRFGQRIGVLVNRRVSAGGEALRWSKGGSCLAEVVMRFGRWASVQGRVLAPSQLIEGLPVVGGYRYYGAVGCGVVIGRPVGMRLGSVLMAVAYYAAPPSVAHSVPCFRGVVYGVLVVEGRHSCYSRMVARLLVRLWRRCAIGSGFTGLRNLLRNLLRSRLRSRYR